MPRTKAPKRGLKNAEFTAETLDVLKEIEMIFKIKQEVLNEMFDQCEKAIEESHAEVLTLPESVLSSTLTNGVNSVPLEATNGDKLNDEESHSQIAKITNEKEGIPTCSSLSSVSESNNVEENLTNNETDTAKLYPTSTLQMKTPMNSIIPCEKYNLITPKITNNEFPIVVRRPNQGEIAFSSKGSPLLVPSVTHENGVHINIPLDGGRHVFLQSERAMRFSLLPELNDSLIEKLDTLRENLNTILK